MLVFGGGLCSLSTSSSVCFLARDSMLSALYAVARPSVRPSVTRVDQPNTVEVRVMPYPSKKFLLYSTPIHLRDKFHSQIRTGSPERGRRRKVGWGKQAIFWLYVSIS